MSNYITIWTNQRFRPHRIVGLLYLLQYCFALISEIFYLENYANILMVTLPATGLTQSIIACNTFTFLPNTNGNIQGYFSDIRTMSYDFILENVFFAGLLLFQALYFYLSVVNYNNIINNYLINKIVIIFVFFPYFVVRPFFPKTSFKKTLENNKERSKDLDIFLKINTYGAKIFYNIAKHINGFLLNYYIFTNKLNISYIRLFRIMLLLGGWGTTIAVFLHTLKFKKILSPTVAVISYTAIFPILIYNYALFFPLYFKEYDLFLLAIGGMYLNFKSRNLQILYQIFVLIYCEFLIDL